MFFDISKAEYVEDYKIKLTFEDGSSGTADLSSYPNPDNVFKKFLNMEYFRNFKIDFGSLTWGNGELDISPEHLYQITTGKEVSFAIKQNAV